MSSSPHHMFKSPGPASFANVDRLHEILRSFRFRDLLRILQWSRGLRSNKRSKEEIIISGGVFKEKRSLARRHGHHVAPLTLFFAFCKVTHVPSYSWRLGNPSRSQQAHFNAMGSFKKILLWIRVKDFSKERSDQILIRYLIVLTFLAFVAMRN